MGERVRDVFVPFSFLSVFIWFYADYCLPLPHQELTYYYEEKTTITYSPDDGTDGFSRKL